MSKKRKLITFLGTSHYQSIVYQFAGRCAQEGRYVQTAIMELFEFSESDEVIVCLSHASKLRNWQPFTFENGETNGGLKEELEQRFAHIPLTVIDGIDDAYTDQDLWRIFDEMVGLVEEHDELILDITHSFRYVPVWGLNIIDFLRTMKNIENVRVVYGNLHKRAGLQTGRLEDVSYMFYLMDWTNGIQSFLQTGSTVLIDRLMTRLQAVYLGSDASLKQLIAVTNRLKQFSMAIQLCRSQKVYLTVEELRKAIRNARSFMQQKPNDLLSLLKPFINLLTPIEQLLAHFTGEFVEDQWFVARWCFEKGLYQQSFTFLQESIVTMITLLAFRDERSVVNEDDRMYAMRSMVHVVEEKPESEWNVTSRGTDSLEMEVKLRVAYHNLLPVKEMLDLNRIESVSNERNDVNHAGYRDSPANYLTLSDNLAGHLEYCKVLFATLQQYRRELPAKRAFVVLSHDLNEVQYRELRKVWQVREFVRLPEDLQVRWSNQNPKGKFSQKSVQEIERWLRSQADIHDLLIVQGEMAAVYSLVLRLQKQGYQPYYATTERIVVSEQTEHADVNLEKTFRHAQFREYPLYCELLHDVAKKNRKENKGGN